MYAASKAYVLSFSEALYFELKEFGISVTALCPGPTDTDFANKAEMDGSKMFDENKGLGMTAKKVAEIGYKGMIGGKMTVVTGFKNKLNVYFSGKMPSRKLVPSFVGKQFKKMIIKK